MRRAERTAIAVLAVVLGCGSSREVSKANFKKVLDAHFSKDCLGVVEAFPAYLPLTKGLGDAERAALEAEHAVELRHYDALIGAGLLSVSEGMQIERNALGEEVVRSPARVYQLTERGKKLYREGHFEPPFARLGKLCVASIAVEKIDAFSQPDLWEGRTASHVGFMYSAKDPTELARLPAVRAAYPEITDLLEGKEHEMAVLVLTDKGWVHEDEAR